MTFTHTGCGNDTKCYFFLMVDAAIFSIDRNYQIENHKKIK
ncbi:hypothetical protein [Akkermansia phage Chantilly]|nr:hypothetical protein [Akkermansia phage Chantilly]